MQFFCKQNKQYRLNDLNKLFTCLLSELQALGAEDNEGI